MSANYLDWSGASRATKLLAALAAGLVMLSVWWLDLFLGVAKSRTGSAVLQGWGWFGLVFLATGVVLIAIVCAREHQRLKTAGLLRSSLAPPFDRPWPIEAGTAWINVEPWVYARDLRIFYGRTAAAVLITILMIAGIASFETHRALQWLVGGLCGAAAVYAWGFLVVEHFQIQRARTMRIGTDGVNVSFDRGDGAIETVSLDTVRLDGFRILIGRRVVVLNDPWRRLVFPLEPLRQLLLARLRPEAFVRNGWVAFHALGRGHPGMVANALGLIGIVAFAIAVELRADWLNAAIQPFASWLVANFR